MGVYVCVSQRMRLQLSIQFADYMRHYCHSSYGAAESDIHIITATRRRAAYTTKMHHSYLFTAQQPLLYTMTMCNLSPHRILRTAIKFTATPSGPMQRR